MPREMYLNLGCGTRYRKNWTNVDFVSHPPDVLGWDLTKRFPLESECVSFLYSSHVLEHFNRSCGQEFLDECFRVVEPGGVIRIVVPDLEAIVQNYLRCLQAQRSDSQLDPTDHLWSVLTMTDQLCRNKSGGEMIAFLRGRTAALLQNVFSLEGPEIEGLHRRMLHTYPVESVPLGRRSKIRLSLGSVTQHTKTILRQLTVDPRREECERVGRFRLSGEVHQWMYDSVSLERALSEAGFKHIALRKADESYVPGWADEHLDTEPDGRVYKPLSLFMEARKTE